MNRDDRSAGRRRARAPQQRGRSQGSAPRKAPPPKADFALPVGTTPGLPPVETFAGLDLPEQIQERLTGLGVTEPFPIQAATLPNALAGRDVLGRGRTGSGKTLAFGLSLLARTAGRRAEPGRPLALVLVPTRELAQQVTDALTPYARAVRLRITTVVGGVSIGKQSRALRDGAEVVIATPGRLRDLIERDDCRLDQIAVTVLDEADQMADMGFMPQVTALLQQVPADGQRMLFSATLDRNVDRLVRRFLTDPVVHSVDPSAGAVSTMEHHVLHVTDEDKKTVTTRIAARSGRVIMFLDTKRSVDRLTRSLLANGVRAGALHGGKSQNQRNRTLAQFKNDQVTVLVATNVAARGIHIDSLDLVVNVDPPGDHKDYLHRGGRTARAGASGTVVTLVTAAQRRDMTRLMADAEIAPQITAVRPEDAELSRITGAREPSGVPVTITEPEAEKSPERAKGASRKGGSGAGRGPRKGGSGSGGPSAGDGSGEGAKRGGRGGRGRGRRPGAAARAAVAKPGASRANQRQGQGQSQGQRQGQASGGQGSGQGQRRVRRAG
ncbi:DEAD/DEAH box helicase [Streptomyces sp. HNM0574]|uniref:DEAD/DEAH box helicase n=1 Tax=Streptomyces sp. HNM0574 TaxID=2714954 RepID=UPI00146D1958|nr:DEAD/DEAH box helicase [Streptomyces sp. HNM0574]NLU69220.1 DEAD/DEAH box helicase [Streptomyces sp. HNM0574]